MTADSSTDSSSEADDGSGTGSRALRHSLRHSPGLLALIGTLAALLLGTLIAQQLYRGPRIKAGIACATTLLALALLLGLYARYRWRWPILTLLLALFYVGTEHLLAPVVMRPFGMKTYYYTKNPDHWPPFLSPPPGMNSDMARCLWEPEEFTDEGLNLIFIGDSFTHGALLNANQTFAHQLTQRLRTEFPDADVKGVNLGWVSSSPFLDLRRLEAQGDGYKPDIVALFLDMTDFQDDIKWRRRLERRGVYGWIYHFPFAMFLFEAWFPESFQSFYWAGNEELPRRRFFMSAAPLAETREDCQPLLDNVDRIHEWCQQRGAEFVLYVLPRSYQYSDRESPNNWEKDEYEILGPYALEPFKLLEEHGEQVAYPVRSLLGAFQETEVFPTCFDHDPHWNAAGATVAAEAIWPSLSQDVRERLGE